MKHGRMRGRAINQVSTVIVGLASMTLLLVAGCESTVTVLDPAYGPGGGAGGAGGASVSVSSNASSTNGVSSTVSTDVASVASTGSGPPEPAPSPEALCQDVCKSLASCDVMPFSECMAGCVPDLSDCNAQQLVELQDCLDLFGECSDAPVFMGCVSKSECTSVEAED